MQQSKRKNSLLYLFLILFVFNSCSLENRIENKQRRAERKIEKLTIKYPQLLKQEYYNRHIKRIYTRNKT